MQKPLKIISSEPVPVHDYLKDLWNKRHVFSALYTRDLKQHYVQTRLGILIVLVKPAIVTLIFTILFSFLIKIPSEGYPYSIFALSGLLSWNLFSIILNMGSSSVEANISLARKMSIPLLTFPLLTAANALTEWVISFVLLILLMIFFAYIPPAKILLIPVALFFNILLGLGVALWLNTMSIRYRDFRHIIPYLVSFGIWVTPVFFPVTIVPQEYLWLVNINPVTGILNLFRVFILNEAFNAPAVLWSIVFSVSIALSGFYFFIRKESDMIDYL